MTALTATSLLVLAAGSALVLERTPWTGRRSTTTRLRAYVRDGSRPRPGAPGTVVRVVTPGLIGLGERISRRAGIAVPLERRLELAGIDDDVERFRLRQFAHGLVALLVALAVVVTASPPLLPAALAVLALPTAAVLAHEERVAAAMRRRRERLRRELPVVVEQLGMLLGAGYSLPGALARLAERSDGVVAADLGRVGRRIRQGLSETAALAEWAERSQLDAVRRLVAVLALHAEAGDLAALVADEARAAREEAHRDLLEDIERRAQMVWVPVTVATLVPGLIFLAVPFTAALSQVTGGP